MQVRTKALIVVVLVLVALGAPANAGPKLRIKGKGLDSTGSRFAFTVKSQNEGRPPRVALDFVAFSITGELECLDSIGGYVIVSGVIDVPIGALQYFRLYAFDGKPGGGPDRVAAELSSAPLACDIDEEEEDGPPVIQRGNVVVKVPPG
jgi:hypothetical protein